MFRFDLSVLSTRSCRTADKVPYKAIQDSASTPERKQRTKKSTSSPARTAKTQSSSTCSANNNASLNSIELDFFPTTSRDACSSAVAAWTTEFTSPPNQDGFRNKSPSPPSSLPLIRKDPSYDSYGKKSSSTISAMGKSASLAGKTVLKNLRKNISLMNTMPSDSRAPTRLTSKIRRNRCKSMPTIPREVSVDFVEGGEGVEITPSASKSDCSYNDGMSNKLLRGKNFLVPEIVRETSTYATTSLTSGEESAEIYQEDDDIRKLCDLMKKIRNHSNHDANNVRFDSDESSALYTFEDTLSAPGQELGTGEIDVNQEACLEPCQAPDSFDDLMVFVNNEHKVLEYAPDEFQEFDSI